MKKETLSLKRSQGPSDSSNKAVQIVTRSPPRASRAPMFDRLGWMSVNQLVFYHSVLTVFKIRRSQEPEYLSSILSKDSRNTRIIIPNLDLSLVLKSFTIRGAVCWNKLPLNTRITQKISHFKKLARQWICDNVPRFQD